MRHASRDMVLVLHDFRLRDQVRWIGGNAGTLKSLSRQIQCKHCLLGALPHAPHPFCTFSLRSRPDPFRVPCPTPSKL